MKGEGSSVAGLVPETLQYCIARKYVDIPYGSMLYD